MLEGHRSKTICTWNILSYFSLLFFSMALSIYINFFLILNFIHVFILFVCFVLFVTVYRLCLVCAFWWWKVSLLHHKYHVNNYLCNKSFSILWKRLFERIARHLCFLYHEMLNFFLLNFLFFRPFTIPSYFFLNKKIRKEIKNFRRTILEMLPKKYR